MNVTTIKVKVKDCQKCNGTGKTEQCEFTPPFEKFIGQCPGCWGNCNLAPVKNNYQITEIIA